MDLQKLADELKSSGQLTNFLALISDSDALFNCSTEKVFPENDYGNIYRRKMHLAHAWTRFEGHAHNFDHMTYGIRGKVLLQTYDKGSDIPQEEYFQAPCAILIKAGVKHTITSITDDCIFECVYALRNFKTGEYTTTWDGDLRAVS